MRAKLVPLALLLSTTVMGGVVFASAAQAGESFRPQGGWSVSKVAAKQSGATPYCALARRFGNGSILTFARNGFDETSVAVDVPKGGFKTGQDITVVFDAGAGQMRSYQTTPVSERGVVIRMGRDDAFYNALEQSGSLGVTVGAETFAFAIPDVKDGTQELAACLGTSVEPAAGGNNAEPVKAAAKSTNAMKQNALETDAKVASEKAPVMASAAAPAAASGPNSDAMQILQEENIRLKNALERERRTYEDKMQQGENTSATAELTEKLRLLEVENHSLRAQVQSGGKAGAVSPAMIAEKPVACAPDLAQNAQSASLKSELAALKEENLRLKVSAESKANNLGVDSAMTALREENARLKIDLQAMQQKLALLESKPAMDVISKGPSENVAALEKRAGDAEIQVAGLKDQIARLQSENDGMKSALSGSRVGEATSVENMKVGIATISKMKAMEDQLSLVKAERDRLSSELASLKSADADGRVKISSDNWNLEQATRRFNEAELEIRRLGSTLEQERAKCAVEKKDLEYMLFDPKIAEKQQIAKLINLEEELNQAKQMAGKQSPEDSKQIAAYEQRVKDLEARIATESQKISAAENRANDLEQQLKMAKLSVQDSAATKEKIASYEKAIKTYEKDLGVAKTALQTSEAEKLKLATYEDRIKAMEQELAAAKANLQKTTVEQADAERAKIATYEQRLTVANQELVAVKASLEKAEAEKARIATLEQDLATARTALQQTGQQAGAEKQKLAAYEASIKDMEAKLNAANTEVASLRKSMAEMEKARVASSEQSNIIDALKQEVASLNGQVGNLQNEKNGMAAQLSQINPAAGGNATGATRMAPNPNQVVRSVEVEPADYGRVAVGNPVPVSAQAIQESSVAAIAAAPVAAAAPVVAPVAAMAAAAVPSNIKMMKPADLEKLLQRAGVQTSGGIQPITASGDAGRVAYRWETNGLFGTAEQKAIQSTAQYDAYVTEYLNKTKSRCTGQFAAIPALEEGSGMNRLSAYEIACVDESGAGASASLAFESRNGVFTTIAHEASPESMDLAMDARDRVISALQSKSASR